ncbi:uncharacterized protein [Paramisgurnus dabryanus]|uniref:uncharacterized protein n=1 Tax=Paramisgurnus dabryanus TaxID=90735 RepID=UPI0031F39063
MSAQSTPYRRPPPMTCKCVVTSTSSRAASYEMEGERIKIATIKTKTISVLTDGHSSFLAPTDGVIPLLEEGETYVIKGHSTSIKYGRKCLFIGPNTKKYLAPPLDLTDEAEQKARDTLTFPSTMMTGEEEDLFTRGGYITIKGKIEKLQVARMITVKDENVPILDLSLRCGDRIIQISMWRDEALTELHLGEEVELSHLRAAIRPDGQCKLNSSTYTRAQVADLRTEETVRIIAVNPGENEMVLLAADFTEYILPTDVYRGTCRELLQRLPLHTTIVHTHSKIISMHGLGQNEM